LYPPRILSVEILSNPFDDIVPREIAPKKKEDEAPKKKKGPKGVKLLFFFLFLAP